MHAYNLKSHKRKEAKSYRHDGVKGKINTNELERQDLK